MFKDADARLFISNRLAFFVNEDSTTFPSIKTKLGKRDDSHVNPGNGSRKLIWSVTSVSVFASVLAPIALLYAPKAIGTLWQFLVFVVLFSLFCLGVTIAASLISRGYKIPFFVNVACLVWVTAFGCVVFGLAMFVGSHFGYANGDPHEYVTFDTELPGDANIVAAKSGPFGPDTKFHLIFDASVESIKDFAGRYAGVGWSTLPQSMEEAFPNIYFGALDYLPEWEIQKIENGRFYLRRTETGTGYLFIDIDRDRVYLQR